MKNKSSLKVTRPLNRMLRIMKISSFLIFVCTFSLMAKSSYSQEAKFSMNMTSVTIRNVMNVIESESEYVFAFPEEVVNEFSQKVTVTATLSDIESVMSQMLGQTDLSYKINGRQISIQKGHQKKEERPSIRVQGIVKDSYGEPLIGVSIQEVGTNNITVTNVDGKFTLYNIAGNNSILRLTYVGFMPQDIKVNEARDFNILLKEDSQNLEEVVVVGYGQQKRESVIGAITTIKPEVLQTNQTRSLTNNLAGQVSGVIAVQRSGEPGYDNSDFWIRGVNTFGANANPLVLIDGIERSMNNISPEEIESFSVLKDATATAIYGVRGANGVILIQTKKGKQGKPTITIKTDYGISNPTKLPKFVDGAKYMEIINEAQHLSGMAHLYTDEDIRRTRVGYDPDLYASVDWLDAVTKRNTPNGRISVDINGGSERLRYSFVTSYFSEGGMIVRDKSQDYDSQLKMKKYNVRSNVDLDLTPSTLVSVSMGGYITDRNAPGVGISSIFKYAMDTPPNSHPIKYSDGTLPKVASRRNPWSDATQTGYQTRFDSNLETSVNLTQDIGKLWEPLKGMKANVLGSFDAFNTHTQKRTKTPRSYYATGRDDEGNLITTLIDQGEEFLNYEKTSGGNRTIYFETKLSYDRKFNKVHHVDALFLFNLRDRVVHDASDAVLALPYRNTGVAGRTAYGFDDRYFAEFNFGYNGSENFRRGKRFGFFPSFAAGWMISNENFMENLSKQISKLKLRASWGLVGNDQLTGSRRFAYISDLTKASGYDFGYTQNFKYTGWREGNFGIPNLTWETAEKINLGVEVGLWDIINFQVEVFKEYRKDIFMQRKTIPELAGFNKAPYANFGQVDNKGIEADLVVNHRFSKDLFLSAKGNFTYATNKVIEYDEPESLKNTSRARTGQSLNQHFGMIAEGLYTEDDFIDPVKGILKDHLPAATFGVVKPGDIKYRDLNEDGKIDSYDESPIGKPYVPEIIYGFGANIKYKMFDLGLFFQGSGNFTNMLQGSTFVPGSGGGGTGNIYSNVDDRWTEENPKQDVFWPRLSNSESSNNMRNSTWWLRDASYLRLKTMEVGFTFPQQWVKGANIRNARIYFRGSNLLTFAKFKMWDPEIGSQNGLKYPLQKIMTFGLEVTF